MRSVFTNKYVDRKEQKLLKELRKEILDLESEYEMQLFIDRYALMLHLRDGGE
jgi:hypothetical protein